MLGEKICKDYLPECYELYVEVEVDLQIAVCKAMVYIQFLATIIGPRNKFSKFFIWW